MLCNLKQVQVVIVTLDIPTFFIFFGILQEFLEVFQLLKSIRSHTFNLIKKFSEFHWKHPTSDDCPWRLQDYVEMWSSRKARSCRFTIGMTGEMSEIDKT